MVDPNTNTWTYVPDTPQNKKCDLDLAAEVILDDMKFRPSVLSIEDYTQRVYDLFLNEMEEKNIETHAGWMLSKSVFRNWLRNNTPLSDFDYIS